MFKLFLVFLKMTLLLNMYCIKVHKAMFHGIAKKKNEGGVEFLMS